MGGEIWKRVIGFEETYEVSDLGRVRRLDTGLILAPRKTTPGYIGVQLKDKPRNKKVQKNIHSIVAEAFVGPRAVDRVVNHKNKDKHDNRLENLVVITKKAR